MALNFIFVTGGRRTGTTLLNAVICADTDANPVIGEGMLICKLMEVLDWATDPYNFSDFSKHIFADTADLTNYFAGMLRDLAQRTSARHGKPGNIVIKSPEFAFCLGQLMDAVPEARFAVSVRDPRDQITSELEVRIRREDGTLDPSGVQLEQVPGLIRKLNRYYDPIFAAEARDPGRFLFVRYEDLLRSFDLTLVRINEFTGMQCNTFDPAGHWPRYAAVDDFVPNYPSYSPLYGQPIEPTRAGRHGAVLRQEDIAAINQGCRVLMQRFGY